jgi:hypothetical protein
MRRFSIRRRKKLVNRGFRHQDIQKPVFLTDHPSADCSAMHILEKHSAVQFRFRKATMCSQLLTLRYSSHPLRSRPLCNTTNIEMANHLCRNDHSPDSMLPNSWDNHSERPAGYLVCQCPYQRLQSQPRSAIHRLKTPCMITTGFSCQITIQPTE